MAGLAGGSGLGGVFGAIDRFQRENLRRFQSELALGNAFNLDCVAHQLEPLSRFLPTLPPARQQQARSTLPEVRRGLARMISGAIDTRRDPVSPANRAVLLLSLIHI